MSDADLIEFRMVEFEGDPDQIIQFKCMAPAEPGGTCQDVMRPGNMAAHAMYVHHQSHYKVDASVGRMEARKAKVHPVQNGESTDKEKSVDTAT